MFYPFASLILLKTWSQKSFFIKHINLNFIFKNVVWKKKKKNTPQTKTTLTAPTLIFNQKFISESFSLFYSIRNNFKLQSSLHNKIYTQSLPNTSREIAVKQEYVHT